MNTFKKIGLCSLALGLAVAAQATLIDTSSTSLLGSWIPGSAYNNPAESQIAVNKLVVWENGGVNPNPEAGVTFALRVPGGGFGDILPSATYVGKDDNAADGWASVDASLYDYVLGKYGNATYVWYLGNLADGPYELALKEAGVEGGQGLSHVSWFSGGGSRVPDSATTLSLLGLGLVAMSFAARRRSAA